MAIHPTAIVDATAELGDVEIGPYAVIEGDTTLADGCEVGPHAVVHRGTRLGARCRVGAHAVLGGEPQDLKHDRGVDTALVVGTDGVFREFVTVHRGSSQGRRRTVLGDRVYLMANSHVAHDCVVGDDVMFANSAAIGGHVEVGHGALLGGLSAVHQHARVGRLAMVGGGAMCAQDVPPFTLAQGDRARLYGLNIIGLKRHGLPATAVTALKDAWRDLFSSEAPRRNAIDAVRAQSGHIDEVRELLDFIVQSTRGLCRTAAS